VLFIDDQKLDTVEILKKAGWDVTRVKDIEYLDSNDIKEAHIIFVDIKMSGEKLSLAANV
jgi:hypothetical protein